MIYFFQIFIVSCLLQNGWTSAPVEEAGEIVEQLKKMSIVTNPLTVSGFSSGASMAQQLHISSSRRFSGVGLFAGVFYRCSGDTKNASFCWNNSRQPSSSIEEVKGYEKRGLVDSLENLKNQKMYFWLGVQDDGMPSIEARLGIISFYQNFMPSPDQFYTKLQSAYHLFPTNSVSQPCTQSAKAPEHNYLANCNYSGSYEVLKFLIGSTITLPPSDLKLQPLRIFNQSEFFGKLISTEIGMDDTGFLYVPTGCLDGNACLLHIFLHGCYVTRELVNDTFIQKSGYLEVGERNNIVMLFPQAASTPEVNPNGCWDYEGFTGPNYATKRGPQIVAINRMVDRLLGIESEEEELESNADEEQTEDQQSGASYFSCQVLLILPLLSYLCQGRY